MIVSYDALCCVTHSQHLACGHESKFSSVTLELNLLVSLVAQTVKSACSAGDLALIPGLGRYPGEVNGCPFQYSCLENSMARGAWQAIAHEVAKSQTQLSD